LRFWKEIVIRAYPKKKISNNKEAISCIVANATIVLIGLSMNISGTILSNLMPFDHRQIPIILEVFIFINILLTILIRAGKVALWRLKRDKKPAK